MKFQFIKSLCLWTLLSQPLLATYSIVAVDRQTRQVGGAVTSCVAGRSVALVYRGLPGVGAVHAQAYSNRQGRDRAIQLLANGATHEQALNAIVSANFDASASWRQYGIVTFDGASGYTGSRNGFYASDVQFVGERFVYSAQGNILTSAKVLSQTQQGFGQISCDLAGRLMNALEWGARNGEGDSRCRPGSASDAAFLQVDLPDGRPLVRLDVKGSRRPIAELRQQFNRWRLRNPCQ